jgi:hypothetical protein
VRSAAVVLAIMLSGCEAQDAPPARPAAVNAGPSSGTPGTWAPPDLDPLMPVLRPQLDLRVSGGESTGLTRIFGLAVDRRERMYVLDATDQVVRVYERDGTPAGALGRRGSGPGEFEHALRLMLRGDSVWVLEPSSGRATVFATGTGAFRTTRVLPRVRTPGRVFDVLRGGFLANDPDPIELGGRSPFGHSTTWRRERLVRVLEDGTVASRLISMENSTGLKFTMHRVGGPRSRGVGGGGISREQPFYPMQWYGVAPSGEALVTTVERGRDPGRDDRVLHVTMVDLHGDTLWSRALRFSPIPVTSSHIAAMIDSLSKPLEGRPGQLWAGDPRMIADSLYRGDVWPAVTGLLVGLDGTIWLREGGPPVDGVRYWQLSEGGAVERRIELPAGFTLLQATRSTMWGWRPDGDEVPLVERYRIPGL